MMTTVAQSDEVISFGPFRLDTGERRLTKDAEIVELGGRAYDILVALLSRPSEVISKRDLMAQVWPDITVEETSLRVHIASLRKALGEGKQGARYISTVAGRGYCFVGTISRSINATRVETKFEHANLPGRITRLIDREDDLRKLSARLDSQRFITIVGSGGVGKTIVAVAIGHQLMEAFSGAVVFVDLSMVSDPALVGIVVASMLGLSVQSDDATPNLITHLRGKRILLILDTCEHLIDTVAALASDIYAAAPQAHILATSREALQVEGEHVYRLEPLACPPDNAVPTAEVIRTFPATQLFLERAVASGAQLDFSDAEAAIVVSMCRKLDGVALAIELAARRVETYGVQQTAALLDEQLTLPWIGPRTAPPRQKTLQATLDWSYNLLSELERAMLRQLAVFVGYFTLDAALAVATSQIVDQTAVFNAIDSLVAKSMVATRSIGATMCYRLLDTTRAYALEIGLQKTDLFDLATRHANYYRKWLEQVGSDSSRLLTGAAQASDFAALNNVRVALEWCFSRDGDARLGIAVAAAAAPVFLAMSLLPECHRWSERALLALDAPMRGNSEEMHLQAGLGIASMQIQGANETARTALDRSLAIAEGLRDAPNQAGLLGMLHMFHFRGGDFNVALNYARRCRTLASTIEDKAAIALAHSILGRSLLMMGDLSGSRAELEALFKTWSPSQQSGTLYLVHDRHFRAGIALARTLWLQGDPVRSVHLARKIVNDAEHMDHPASLTVIRAWAASVFLWTGDLRSAEEYITSSIAIAESYSLGPLAAVGRARQAQLAIQRGEVRDGVASLQASLKEIHSVRYELITTEFNISLVQGLAALGRAAEANMLLAEAIQQVERNGDTCYMAELLRVKAGLLQSAQARIEEVEGCLKESLQLSRRQGARAWELRSAMDLAKLLVDQGQLGSARALLQPVYARFVEGFDTADLLAANRLLASLT